MAPWKEKFFELFCKKWKKDHQENEAIKLLKENIPTSLYRYRSVNSYSLDDLINSTVWLAPPESLNDPYDCRFFYDVKKIKDYYKKNPTLASGLRAFYEIFTGNALSETKEKELDDQVLLPLLENWIVNVVKEGLEGRTRICSFSERVDCMPMWAHYSDNHKGFCIEYDVSQFSFATRSNLYPVIYSEKACDLTDYFTESPDKLDEINPFYIKRVAFQKAQEWSYEKEWRVMMQNNSPDFRETFPIGQPKCVYLGAKILAGNEAVLRTICEKLDVPVLKMKASNDRYIMEPEVGG